ncbi:MAG: HAD-IB family hydrolase [Deltaproteobacteria bacterium]|nr:HAD-IB family hydrolase [Candidatus Zymogenaceae bacterium]
MRSAALFDFDNTLIDNDSQGLEVEYFWRRREISPVRIAHIVFVHLITTLRIAPKAAIVRACIATHRGRDRRELFEHGERFFREVTSRRFFPEVVERMREHKDRGDLVAVLTASPAHLVAPAARVLGVDLVVTTQLEEDARGLLSGRTRGKVNIGSVKAEAARTLLAEHGIDPSRATAYSDDQADLEFLLTTGRAVVVNPTPRLSRIARKRGWEIIRPLSVSRLD